MVSLNLSSVGFVYSFLILRLENGAASFLISYNSWGCSSVDGLRVNGVLLPPFPGDAKPYKSEADAMRKVKDLERQFPDSSFYIVPVKVDYSRLIL